MTNKTVTMSRELAQKIDDLLYIMTGHDSYPRLIHKYGKEWWTPINEMRAEICTLLAAPVVERQPAPLLVWEGAMPESNGKSNFTVILHTGDLTEGICVYRSEYPDRARYEADCFRHLIGDPALTEKPFICDYDAEKHSGYVKPDASPPAPVAVALPERKHPRPDGDNTLASTYNAACGWNACLDKVKELNQ